MLTTAQRIARQGKLTGSRIACLMTGDAERIDRLYREMIGEEVEEDLSGAWPVQLGEATEKLNLRWYARKTGKEVTRQGEVVPHHYLAWAAVTLDGWCETLNCPIEAKHC